MWQVSEAAVQSLPQLPQLVASLIIATHFPLQQASSFWHFTAPWPPAPAHWQIPPMQVKPAAQGMPHAPQLWTSVLVSVHLFRQHLPLQFAQLPVPAMSFELPASVLAVLWPRSMPPQPATSSSANRATGEARRANDDRIPDSYAA